MRKPDYLVPDEAWPAEQFANIPFGVMRPSEMEILPACFIIYHNGADIERSTEYLSEKYKLSESKTKRFQIEFAARFRKNSMTGKLLLY